MSKRANARKALEELKAARAAGRSGLDAYKVSQRGSIYEEVDEEGYKKVVRDRLNQDDFVVDDNGEGYADDGREDWQDERQRYDSGSESEELPLKGKAAKRKREEEKERKENSKNQISNYFNNGPAAVVAAPKPKVNTEDSTFLWMR